MAKPGVNVAKLTMSPAAYQIKRRATKKQWHRIVAKAKRRGVTVDALLDQSVPGPLKDRTRESLRKQATNTINEVYKPAELELTQRESRVRAVDEKRARDNQYYLDWLKGRSDAMTIAARQADTTLRDTQRQIVDDAAAHTQAVQQEMMQAAAAQAGNVSNPGQAAAFNISDDAARNNALLAASREATNQTIGTGERRQSELDASNFAQIAALEAKRQADTWSKLSDIGDSGEKLKLQKAADAAQEVARLLDQNQANAQGNREAQVVAQRLGVDLAGVRQRERDSRRDARTAADRLDETRRNNRANLRLRQRQQRFDESIANAKLDIDQGKLNLGWYKAKHPGSSGGSGKGTGLKSKNPQDRFEYGYALVATSVRQGKPRKDGTYPNIRYNAKWVSENQDLVKRQLIKEGFSARMAKTIVTAFMQKDGKDPGDVALYRPERHDVRGQ